MDINKIFSREALNKLRSPEKLDTLLPITTPINWMALIAIGILLFSVVLWSIFGAFTVKVDGRGMIMDSAGVVNVSHISDGKIKQIYVHSGSKIKKGDLIARMEQPVQDADTRMSQYNIALSQSDRDAMSRASEHDAKKTQELVNEYIYSDYDGIVDEIMVETGSIINVGTPICSIRRTQNRDELTGVLYIPVEQGKRVEPGMSIQLSPNGVDTSQSGWLLGVVRSVSQYPISTTAMNKVLGNEQLVQYILNNEQGAVMEVKFDLVKDENSESGYLWTSFVGKHKPITAGSFCTGSIIIDRVPPIEKVFYKFSQWLRSR
ncbi:NHLP bacteriocin system secretion protein [uncultured Megamonas sp.]|uniref:NHLP bacteriocin system secretion protein n=1 Tax=uncultured Megamonas sp. TaxID=286140 RepID=UPI00266F7FC2|nr:NHLP bacteriocin system secretion protein [uncultured Megamonas sp.]